MKKLFLIIILSMFGVSLSSNVYPQEEIPSYRSCEPNSSPEPIPSFMEDLLNISKKEIKNYEKILGIKKLDFNRLIRTSSVKSTSLEGARKNAFRNAQEQYLQSRGGGKTPLSVLRQEFSFDECDRQYICYMITYIRE